jgi:hypothetical protein
VDAQLLRSRHHRHLHHHHHLHFTATAMHKVQETILAHFSRKAFLREDTILMEGTENLMDLSNLFQNLLSSHIQHSQL